MNTNGYDVLLGMTVAADDHLDAASRFMAEFWDRVPDHGWMVVKATGGTQVTGPGQAAAAPSVTLRHYYRVWWQEHLAQKVSDILDPGTRAYRPEEVRNH